MIKASLRIWERVIEMVDGRVYCLDWRLGV